MKDRASQRGECIQFNVSQLRTKLKKCVSECKQAALTMKSATGIKRFKEVGGFGKCFITLFPLVKIRDSCNLELLEEHSSIKRHDENSSNGGKENLFIPVKKKRKRKMIDQVNETVLHTLNATKDAMKSDQTKELITYFREEMHKSREHDLKSISLMLNSRQTNGSSQTLQVFSSFNGFTLAEIHKYH